MYNYNKYTKGEIAMKKRYLILLVAFLSLFVLLDTNDIDAAKKTTTTYVKYSNGRVKTKKQTTKDGNRLYAIVTTSYNTKGRRIQIDNRTYHSNNRLATQKLYKYRSNGKRSSYRYSKWNSINEQTYRIDYKYNKRGQLKSNKYGKASRYTYKFYYGKVTYRYGKYYNKRGKLNKKTYTKKYKLTSRATNLTNNKSDNQLTCSGLVRDYIYYTDNTNLRTAKLNYRYGSIVLPATSYKSSNTKIATISNNGTITLRGTGSATLSMARPYYASKSITIKVVEGKYAYIQKKPCSTDTSSITNEYGKIEYTKSETLLAPSTFTKKSVKLYDVHGQYVKTYTNLSDLRNVKSSNTSVVGVGLNNVLNAKTTGTATISFLVPGSKVASDEPGYVEGSFTISVKEFNANNATLNPVIDAKSTIAPQSSKDLGKNVYHLNHQYTNKYLKNKLTINYSNPEFSDIKLDSIKSNVKVTADSKLGNAISHSIVGNQVIINTSANGCSQYNSSSAIDVNNNFATQKTNDTIINLKNYNLKNQNLVAKKYCEGNVTVSINNQKTVNYYVLVNYFNNQEMIFMDLLNTERERIGRSIVEMKSELNYLSNLTATDVTLNGIVGQRQLNNGANIVFRDLQGFSKSEIIGYNDFKSILGQLYHTIEINNGQQFYGNGFGGANTYYTSTPTNSQYKDMYETWAESKDGHYEFMMENNTKYIGTGYYYNQNRNLSSFEEYDSRGYNFTGYKTVGHLYLNHGLTYQQLSQLTNY
ncbi:hypothetical protein OKW23_000714 [Bacilli bacterium PM5-9]|nr:hypothetical protein [Bacilli bacterium PM5-9]